MSTLRKVVGFLLKGSFVLAIIYLAPFVCLVGGCYALGLIQASTINRQRRALEHQNPSNTIRVVDDNPGKVNVSPGGEYMFRHYDAGISDGPIPNADGVLENLVTGEKFYYHEWSSGYAGVYEWMSDSLFLGPNDCLYDPAIPDTCAAPLANDFDESGNYAYTVEFILENSQQVFAVNGYMDGLGKDTQGEVIVYRRECNHECRTDLKQNIAITASVTLLPYKEETTYSPDGQLYSIFEMRSGCITLYGSLSGAELTHTCKDDFFSVVDLIPLGWNVDNSGYYFQISTYFYQPNGDGFLLTVP